jgi:hypothetical protein
MTPTSLQRFRQIVESYGSRPQRWPEPEREAALALLEYSAEARELVQQQTGLDRVIGDFELPELPAPLQRRLAEIPVHAGRQRRFGLRRMWAPILAWSLAGVSGVWLGTAFPDEPNGTRSEPAAANSSTSEDAVLAVASGSFADMEDEP